LIERYGDRERPYFATLRRKLQQGFRAGITPDIDNEQDVDTVLDLLRLPQQPFVERTSVFLFYRAWSHKKSLKDGAAAIAASAHEYVANKPNTEHHAVLKHFRADLVAQLLRDTRLKQRYAGFETFVRMSAGLPRGLLTILKHVFTWSSFFGEKPFRGTPISLTAQAEGVVQASEWFFMDARAPGPIGTMVRDAMTRVGQLLRDIRFSDKPSESSICAFSADVTKASELAREVLDAAHDWSMLVRIPGGQHDRNVGRVDDKYQVHPMLAPRWDLPMARRGALALTGEEIDALFAPKSKGDFPAVLERRISPMTAPYFGSSGYTSLGANHGLFADSTDG
jgi:hypothetical protein